MLVTISVRTNTHVLLSGICQSCPHCTEQTSLDRHALCSPSRPGFATTQRGHLLLQCLIELAFTKPRVHTPWCSPLAGTCCHGPPQFTPLLVPTPPQLAVAHMLQHCSGTPSTNAWMSHKSTAATAIACTPLARHMCPCDSGVNSCQASNFFERPCRRSLAHKFSLC